MENLIAQAFVILTSNEEFVMGEDIGHPGAPIWRGVQVAHSDAVLDLCASRRGLRAMTLAQILGDPDACGLVFDHILRVHFEGLMGA